MYCQNCGNEVSENAVFCERCGTSLKREAPATPTTAKETGMTRDEAIAKIKKRYDGHSAKETPPKSKKRVTARTFLSIGLLISFFLPWIDFGRFTTPSEMDLNSVYQEAIRQNRFNEAGTIAGLSAKMSSLYEDIGGLSGKVVNGFNLYIIGEKYNR